VRPYLPAGVAGFKMI